MIWFSIFKFFKKSKSERKRLLFQDLLCKTKLFKFFLKFCKSFFWNYIRNLKKFLFLNIFDFFEKLWKFSPFHLSFGVDASAPVGGGVMMAAMPAGGAAEAAPKEEEKTLFDVVLEEIPAEKKVGVYKVVRNIANIAVNQVKDFTATLPKTLKESISKEEAEAAKQQLEEVGAKVKIV